MIIRTDPTGVRDLEEARAEDIEWIDTLSTNAKAIWFSFLGYIAFVGASLLSVEDADFFVEDRQTELPLIGIAIPTSEFFLIGPLLGTIVYVYLHVYLLKLWDALAAVPAKVGNRQISQKITPWLVNDFGLWLRFDGAIRSHPMALFVHMVTFLLIFGSGPAIIGAFWVRFWPAHELWTSLVVACLFALTLSTMCLSIVFAVARLRLAQQKRGAMWSLFGAVPFVLMLSCAIPLTVAKTDGYERVQAWPLFGHLPFINWDDAFWQIASANLREVEFVPIPDDWLPYETRKVEYRRQWCDTNSIPISACGAPPHGPLQRLSPALDQWNEQRLLLARDMHCESLGLNGGVDLCKEFFSGIEERFWEDWKSARRLEIEALDTWIGQAKDLRGADLSFARLDGADLRGTRLNGATLWGTSLEGAQFAGADLQNATFDSVNMELADFTNRRLSPTENYEEIFGESSKRQLSIGWNSSLEGAFLYGMQIEVRSLVKLEGAYLPYSLVTGGRMDLAGAMFGSTAFRDADLTNAFAGLLPDLSYTFGDGSVSLPQGVVRPCHWPKEILDDREFFGRWLGWKQSLGDVGKIPGLEEYEVIAPILSEGCS